MRRELALELFWRGMHTGSVVRQPARAIRAASCAHMIPLAEGTRRHHQLRSSGRTRLHTLVMARRMRCGCRLVSPLMLCVPRASVPMAGSDLERAIGWLWTGIRAAICACGGQHAAGIEAQICGSAAGSPMLERTGQAQSTRWQRGTRCGSVKLGFPRSAGRPIRGGTTAGELATSDSLPTERAQGRQWHSRDECGLMVEMTQAAGGSRFGEWGRVWMAKAGKGAKSARAAGGVSFCEVGRERDGGWQCDVTEPRPYCNANRQLCHTRARMQHTLHTASSGSLPRRSDGGGTEGRFFLSPLWLGVEPRTPAT